MRAIVGALQRGPGMPAPCQPVQTIVLHDYRSSYGAAWSVPPPRPPPRPRQQVFTTSGRRRPPPGRWVSSGREALKSGLNIPGVAESYDEGGNLINARYAKGYKSPQQLQEELEKLSSDRAAAAAAATASSSSAATSSSSLSSAASSWRRPQEPQQLEQPARSQSRQAQPAAQTQRLRASWREALAAEVEGGADSDGGQAEAAAPKKYSAWR